MPRLRYTMYNEDGTSLDRGLLMTDWPKFDTPGEQVRHETIPGRDGSLTVHTGTYPDWTVTIQFEIIGQRIEDLEQIFRDNCRWLKNSKRISFADAPDHIYRVKKVEIMDIVRDEDVVCDFTCVFTVWPGIYLKGGEQEMNLSSNIVYNYYDFCKPIYKIVGEGVCELMVNDNVMQANVGQNLTIDTELMLAYRSDGTIRNTSISGDYEEMWLKAGENDISITAGFALTIIPRWRIMR